MHNINTRALMSDTKFYEGYSRWNEELERYETWEEAVSRVMDMHREYYSDKMTPELENLLSEAENAYKLQNVLGAQRALQFGGEQLLKHQFRLYNCASTYVDRAAAFGEIFYVLLCGAGMGFSVQKHHVAKLSEIALRKGQAKQCVPEDSIEGWANALDVLISSYMVDGGKHPEYAGRKVYFDLSLIRPKGAFISGGFKAPGPEPLRRALDKIEYLLQGLVLKGETRLRPIHVYDIIMYAADAVLSGGVRRSATICLFSDDDDEMMNAKTGNWFVENPQRGRSNNSAVVVRKEVDRSRFSKIMKPIKEFGEPAFYFVESREHTSNPCVTGDTMLSIRNGDQTESQIRIDEYVNLFKSDPENAPEVLSQNVDTGAIEWSKVDGAELTRKNTDIIEIILDDGKSIRCTPDHKIFTSNRGYVEAKDLTEDDDIVVDGTSKLCSIRKSPSEDVYDISVPSTRNFFANGILVHNCVEIGMLPQLDGESGIQGCNLTEINGGKCSTKEIFYRACRAAAILGTLQAGYTKFKFVSETTRKIFEREALLGVSVTGWMNNPDVLFDEEVMKRGAEIVREVNKEVSALIGINPAARATAVKPSGNASVLLQTASGIHAEHAPKYLRHIQLNKESEVAQLIVKTNPYMVEESVWSEGRTDYSIAFPIIPKEGSYFRNDLTGVDFLEKVKKVQQTWIEHGTNIDLCVDPTVRHNVSNTVTVKSDQWDEVEDYIFENRYLFSGVSFLAASGDKDYVQAPNAEVLSEEEIVQKYGTGAIFASGLIVDAFKGFENVWEATSTAQFQDQISGEMGDMRADWIRRFRKFADNYFNGDIKQAEYCLKDVAYLHKWTKIQQNIVPIDFTSQLSKKEYTDIDTLGAAACSGGQCEVEF